MSNVAFLVKIQRKLSKRFKAPDRVMYQYKGCIRGGVGFIS